MIIINCEQGSPEWRAARIGVITASRCKDACDRLKSGDFSAKALGYAATLAHERVSQESCDDTFVNFAMRRGSELEASARAAYEMETGLVAQESGIALTDDAAFGYSTDGFVGADGAIEIKCPLSPLVVQTMWFTGDMSEYEHQIQMGMWLTGRKWIDFVMFDPRLQIVGKALYLRRILRDDDFIERTERRLLEFRVLVDENEAGLRTLRIAA